MSGEGPPVGEERSLELIDELSRDLAPVQQIPRLRTVLTVLVGLWFLVAVVGVGMLGLRPDLSDILMSQRGALAVFAGLVLAGGGGLVGAVAMGVPGRERLARVALMTGLVGMVLAAGVGTLLFLNSPAASLRTPYAFDLRCLAIACVVASLPATGVIWFAGRAAPNRPLVLVLAAAAGTAALGAVTAQASCPGDYRHLLMGHVFAPAVGTLVLSLPLLIALKRIGR